CQRALRGDVIRELANRIGGCEVKDTQRAVLAGYAVSCADPGYGIVHVIDGDVVKRQLHIDMAVPLQFMAHRCRMDCNPRAGLKEQVRKVALKYTFELRGRVQARPEVEFNVKQCLVGAVTLVQRGKGECVFVIERFHHLVIKSLGLAGEQIDRFLHLLDLRKRAYGFVKEFAQFRLQPLIDIVKTCLVDDPLDFLYSYARVHEIVQGLEDTAFGTGLVEQLGSSCGCLFYSCKGGGVLDGIEDSAKRQIFQKLPGFGTQEISFDKGIQQRRVIIR